MLVYHLKSQWNMLKLRKNRVYSCTDFINGSSTNRCWVFLGDLACLWYLANRKQVMSKMQWSYLDLGKPDVILFYVVEQWNSSSRCSRLLDVKRGLFRGTLVDFLFVFISSQKKLFSRDIRLVEDYITCSRAEWWAKVFLLDRLCLASYSVIQFSLSVQSPCASRFRRHKKTKGHDGVVDKSVMSVVCLKPSIPIHAPVLARNPSLSDWASLLSDARMHAQPPTPHSCPLPKHWHEIFSLTNGSQCHHVT